jgi:hypothetical protein
MLALPKGTATNRSWTYVQELGRNISDGLLWKWVPHNAAYLVHPDIHLLQINYFEANHIENITPQRINNYLFLYLGKYSRI